MLGIRYIKVQPTTYLLQYRRGKLVREGAGLAFYYYAPFSTLAAVPIASRDTGFMLELVTADFQTVSVQGEISFRIDAPRRAAALLDYSLNAQGAYNSQDPRRLPERVVVQAKVIIQQAIQRLNLRDALRAPSDIAHTVHTELGEQAEIQALGLSILGVSIIAIHPTKDIARALEAEAREANLQAADDAVYQRRMAAVQNERAIRQNELDTEVAVEEKRRQIEETKLEAKAALARRQHEVDKAHITAEIILEEERRTYFAVRSENLRTRADADAYRLHAFMRALEKVEPKTIQLLTESGMNPDQLIAQAFGDLAARAEKIGQLSISPELLQGLLQPKPEKKRN